MSRMIPPRLRGRGLLSPGNLVRFTGLCEIAGGIGLLVPATRGRAGEEGSSATSPGPVPEQNAEPPSPQKRGRAQQ
jgi:hypothetical protein